MDKEKRTKKYMMDVRYKKRRERMAKELKHYCAPYYLMDEKYIGNGMWEIIPKPYIRKTYRSAGCSRYGYFKRHSNRMVRRYSGFIPKGNGYRKIFDYQWEID